MGRINEFVPHLSIPGNSWTGWNENMAHYSNFKPNCHSNTYVFLAATIVKDIVYKIQGQLLSSIDKDASNRECML